MNEYRTRIAADREVEKLLTTGTPNDKKGIEGRDGQGRQWRRELIEMEIRSGIRRGGRGQSPGVNNSQRDTYEA